MLLAAVDDLMFSSRISTTAKAVGTPVQFARSMDAVLAAARGTPAPALIVIDLNSARLGPLDIVSALKADAALAAIPIVGFVSHVDTATIEAARAAGIDRVMARSAFVQQLAEMIGQDRA